MRADTAPLLQLEGISKSFPGVRALNDVDFEVLPGEVHILLGENGAGKSTLIKIISGAYSADSGIIRISGNQVHIASPTDAIRLGISTIYQEFNLAPHLSVLENLLLGRERVSNVLGKMDWNRMRDDSLALLRQLDIDDIDPNCLVQLAAVQGQGFGGRGRGQGKGQGQRGQAQGTGQGHGQVSGMRADHNQPGGTAAGAKTSPDLLR